jgi:hypothetical protein
VGRAASSSALWQFSNNGAPMSYKAVGRTLESTTFFLFRTSERHQGQNPHLAAALLHHVDPAITNEHYNRASSFSAAQSLGKS